MEFFNRGGNTECSDRGSYVFIVVCPYPVTSYSPTGRSRDCSVAHTVCFAINAEGQRLMLADHLLMLHDFDHWVFYADATDGLTTPGWSAWLSSRAVESQNMPGFCVEIVSTVTGLQGCSWTSAETEGADGHSLPGKRRHVGPEPQKTAGHKAHLCHANKAKTSSRKPNTVLTSSLRGQDFVRALSSVLDACTLQVILVVSSVRVTTANITITSSFLDACCLLIVIVLDSLCNLRNGTEDNKQCSQCVGNSKWTSKRSSHNVNFGKFQMYVKECAESKGRMLASRKCRLLCITKDDGISDLFLWKKCPDETKKWNKLKNVGDVDCLDYHAVLKDLLNMAYVQRIPHIVEVRPVTGFLPDATRDPSRYLAHVGYRLATLSALPPSVDVSRVKLANAGFYSRGQRDEVICYSCGLCHSGWRSGDDPMAVHRRLSPRCEHVVQTDRELRELTEATGDAGGRTAEGQSLASENQHGALSSSSQRAGPSSATSQQPGDGSGSQHLSPQPQSLQQSSLTPATTTSHNNGTTVASRSSTVPVTSAASVASDSRPASRLQPLFPQPRLNLGNATHPSQYNSQGRRLTFRRWDETRAPPVDELLLSGFFYAGYADCVVCFYCGIRLKDWQAADSADMEHVRHGPNCGFLRDTKGAEFIRQLQGRLQASQQPANTAPPTATTSPSGARPTVSAPSPSPSRGASGSTLGSSPQAPDTGSQGPAAASPRPAASSAVVTSSSGRASSSSSLPASSQPNQGAAVPRPERVGGGGGGVNTGQRCRECRHRPVDTLVMPCAHLVLCEVCVRTVRICPLCGAHIQASARVYME